MTTIYNRIWSSALKSIQRRMMSRFDLKRKLMTKFPDEERDVLKILDEMERVELLNDKRYTEQLINHLTQRPIGRIKIKMEARKRGLDEDMMQSALQKSGYDEEKACKIALEQKEKTVSESDPRKRKQKLMNFLRSRGFTDSVIWGTLR